jgi:hypothetical protein
MTHYWPNFASLSDIHQMITSYGFRDLSYLQRHWYRRRSSGIMPCRLVNSHTSEGFATPIIRVVQKGAIFFLVYADVEGEILGVSNCTRIYTASCSRRLKFYSYYFFVTLGATSKAHHSPLLYSAWNPTTCFNSPQLGIAYTGSGWLTR